MNYNNLAKDIVKDLKVKFKEKAKCEICGKRRGLELNARSMHHKGHDFFIYKCTRGGQSSTHIDIKRPCNMCDSCNELVERVLIRELNKIGMTEFYQ